MLCAFSGNLAQSNREEKNETEINTGVMNMADSTKLECNKTELYAEYELELADVIQLEDEMSKMKEPVIVLSRLHLR